MSEFFWHHRYQYGKGWCMEMEEKSSKLDWLRRQLPVEYQDSFVRQVDPMVLRMLADPDSAFVLHVKRHLEAEAVDDAKKFGYTRWCLVPRFGRRAVLMSGTV